MAHTRIVNQGDYPRVPGLICYKIKLFLLLGITIGKGQPQQRIRRTVGRRSEIESSFFLHLHPHEHLQSTPRQLYTTCSMLGCVHDVWQRGGQVKFSNAKKFCNSPLTVIEKNSNPPQAVRKNSTPPYDGKMEVEVNDRKSDKKHEWEKYLYPFSKTGRMVYYNKVVKYIL